MAKPPHSTAAAAANAAIHYRAEAFDTNRQKLMGRHAAGAGFLRGFVTHAGVESFYCYSPAREMAAHFKMVVDGFGSPRQVKWLDESDAAQPGSVGTLYLSDPNLAPAAWRRRAHGQRLYSICGITHTTASAGAMDMITGLLTAPIQSWDALICTSTAVLATVDRLVAAQREFLAARLGATTWVMPQLPVIPLGVDSARFAPDDARRDAARAALGIGAEDVVFLFVGRLSFHAKAHPLPMYLALERVAQALARQGGRRVHLIQAGWFANDFIEKSFRDGAAQFCPGVTCHFLDGRKAELRDRAWRAADIFTSLSDNFQETFGLTPIEAMAAGLPGVVSDWDGYRDTIRDGIDGIRVPTLMPRDGLGVDMADRHAAGLDNYDVYCGLTSQFVSVDLQAVTRAYMSLAEDRDLRRRMGAAARRRALDTFDWAHIIASYQALWRELAERRRADSESAAHGAGPAHPARADPFHAFAGYASAVLAADHVVAVMLGADGARLNALMQSPLISYVKPMAPDADDCARLLAALQRQGPQRVSDVLTAIPETRRKRLERGLVWLAKLGLVSIRPGKDN
jgi:glycosyltransferase involved in cell wall biosynthesis